MNHVKEKPEAERHDNKESIFNGWITSRCILTKGTTMCNKDECMKRFDKIDTALRDLNKKLFIGNGKDPLDMRVDRNTRLGRVAIWVSSGVFVMFLGVVGRLIYTHLSR